MHTYKYNSSRIVQWAFFWMMLKIMIILLASDWNVFLPEIRWRPKKNDKWKKGLRPCWNRVLQPNSFQVQSNIPIANDNGCAIFSFRAKIGLKSNKNRVFCILCMPMGDQTPLPQTPLATLLLLVVSIGILPFILPQLPLFLSLSIWERKKAKCRFSQLKLARVNAASDIFYSRPKPKGSRLDQAPSLKRFSLLGNGATSGLSQRGQPS